MTEQERLYDIYKDYGITREYIQRVTNEYLKLGEPSENVFALVRAALALAVPMPGEFKLNDYAVMVKKSQHDSEVKKQFDELQEELFIAARYRGYGVSVYLVDGLVQSGLENGLTRKAALAGVRMGLAKEYGQHEYFTAEDVSEILGMTVEEADKLLIEQSKEGLLEAAQITYSPIVQ